MASSSGKGSRAAMLKELRARVYGMKEAGLELGAAAAASATRIVELAKRRWIPAAAAAISSSASRMRIPSSWTAAANGGGRGIAMAPRLLLLGLLLLQLIVLGVLRSSFSQSGPPLQESAPRTLYSIRRITLPSPPPEQARVSTVLPRVSAAERGTKAQEEENEELKEPKLHEEAQQDRSDEILAAETTEEEESANVGTLEVDPHEAVAAALNAGDLAVTLKDDHEEQIEEQLGHEEQHQELERQVEDHLEHQEQVREHEEQAQVGEKVSDHLSQQSKASESSTEESEQELHVSKNTDDEEQQKEQDDREVAASEAAIIEEDPVCKGGRIYVYDLPPKFNQDLLANCSTLNPWLSLCDALSNGGLGKPMAAAPWLSPSSPSPQSSWFYTEQFSGELIFHTRILAHPCTTNDSAIATTFYVPFYAGLDVSRFLWKPSLAAERDALSSQLLSWLESQPQWQRRGGVDHFMMIGRITWDFRREADKNWGSGFLHSPSMKNMTRLVIESNPWEKGEYGVPYPTAFHPSSDEQLQDWQDHLRSRRRPILFAFAGATRQRIPNDFRLQLLAECAAARDAAAAAANSTAAAGIATASSAGCSAMDCSEGRCESPEPVISLFLNTTFCLQPRGDSYTRRSIFDAAVAGCIPVFFWNQSSYWQYKWFFPSEDEAYSVFIDREDVRSGKLRVREVLAAIPDSRVEKMRNELVAALPRLVYAAHGHKLSVADGFDTAVDGVLRTMLRSNLREERQKQRPEEGEKKKKKKKKSGTKKNKNRSSSS